MHSSFKLGTNITLFPAADAHMREHQQLIGVL